STKPATPQAEPSPTVTMRLGNDNDNCGNIRGFSGTTITYKVDTIAEIQHLLENSPQSKSPPTIRTSVGDRNKNSAQIEDFGSTRIIINQGTAAGGGHQTNQPENSTSS
ncbi:hypothetical protein HOY80DRAFT_857791, partial [Tuber brumale]